MTTPTTQREADEREITQDWMAYCTILRHAGKEPTDAQGDAFEFAWNAARVATDQPSAGHVDERALFEQEANAARFFPREIDFSLTKSPSGRDEYANSHLQSRWEGWQAGRASLTPTAPQAATTAACQPSTLTGQPDAAICQPAATTASTSLDQQMNAVMAVPDESLDDHLRSIGLDPAECEAAGRRALAGAINAVATTASATDQAKAAHVAWRDKKDGRAQAPSQSAPLPKQGEAHALAIAANFDVQYDAAKGVHHYYGFIENIEGLIERAALASAPLPTKAVALEATIKDTAKFIAEWDAMPYAKHPPIQAVATQAVDVARDAARYRVLRSHVAPRDVSISMTVPVSDIPANQTIEERIDMLCDIVLSRTNTTGGSEE